MMFSDEYELSSNTEIDMLLADLPFQLIKENLRYQINNPLLTNVNYVESVIDKFRVLQQTYGEDEDALKNINSLMRDFFSFLISEIDSKFDLSIEKDIDAFDNFVEVGMALYNFLILRYKKNITKYIFKFIIKNKKLLVEEFEKSYKKKDVTSIAIKRTIKNKDDILILSTLPSIIKYIMSLEIESLEFMKYACSEGHYEGFVIRSLITQGYLIGNFTPKYLGLIVDQFDTVLDEIQTDVKLKLMKKI